MLLALRSSLTVFIWFFVCVCVCLRKRCTLTLFEIHSRNIPAHLRRSQKRQKRRSTKKSAQEKKKKKQRIEKEKLKNFHLAMMSICGACVRSITRSNNAPPHNKYRNCANLFLFLFFFFHFFCSMEMETLQITLCNEKKLFIFLEAIETEAAVAACAHQMFRNRTYFL